MWIVRLALRRPYTFVVAAMLVAIMGILAILRMPTDIFPVINIPVVSVVWGYTGLPADQMEGRITTPFERVLTTTVDNIERIESQALNGVSVTRVYFQPGASIDKGIAQVTAIGQTILRSLPPGSNPPLVIQYSASSVPVLQLSVESDTIPENRLFDLVFNFLRPQLITVPGVQIPFPYGGKQRQVVVDLDPKKLYAYGISPADVSSAVNAQNLILPAGAVKIGRQEYQTRVNSAAESIAALNDLPIRTVNGRTVYVRDVANVRDGFAVQTSVVNANGKRSVLVSVLKAGNASTLDVVSGVLSKLEQARPTLPEGLTIKPLFDQSVFVRASVEGVVKEAAIAAGLTGLMILLFLGSWRSTLIVMISIPLSILVSIIVLWGLGETLNVMTLGGMALAVGILVDDATVEIENIHRNLHMGKRLVPAILDGARQIAVPAFVSTLSICIVFVPVAFIAGAAKFLFTPLAMSVVFAMLTSYLLSRTLVPTMVHYLLASEVERYGGRREQDEGPSDRGRVGDDSARGGGNGDGGATGGTRRKGRALGAPAGAMLVVAVMATVLLTVGADAASAQGAPGGSAGAGGAAGPGGGAGWWGNVASFLTAHWRAGALTLLAVVVAACALYLVDSLNLIWRTHEAFNAVFERFRRFYGGLLALALRHRLVFTGAFLAAVTLTLVLVLPGVGRDFFPSVDAGLLRVHVRCPPGTRIDESERRFAQVEALIREIIPKEEIADIIANIGIPNSGINLSLSDGSLISPADGELLVSLREGHKPSPVYARQIRREVARRYPDLLAYFAPADIVGQVLNFGLAAPIDVQFVGPAGNRDANYEIARKLAAEASATAGIVDVRLAQVPRTPDIRVNVDRDLASRLNVTQRDVASDLLISLSSSSQTAPNFFLNPQNGVNYSILVQTPEYKVGSLQNLLQTPIVSSEDAGAGGGVGGERSQLLENLSSVGRGTSPTNVTHYNILPTMNVLMGVYGTDLGTAAERVKGLVEKYSAQLPRGSRMELRGQIESMNASYTGLGLGLVFAVVLVYLLMTVNFQSWLDPMIILTALPGAAAGIVWMLWASHTHLSVPALMGALMCVGVATSNSILMVTFANDQRAGGLSAVDSALTAGLTRLRPVIMTALAMGLGMLPMSLGLGEGGEQNAPLGRAVIGGLTVATFATLFFVPVMYSLLRTKPPHHAVEPELQEGVG